MHCRACWASPEQVGGTVVKKAVGRNGTGNRAAGQGDEGTERCSDPAGLLPCCRLVVKAEGSMVPSRKGAAEGKVLDPPLFAC